MKVTKLRKAVDGHSGAFHCVKIHEEGVKKVVQFAHAYDPPAPVTADIPKALKAFYETFGDLTLYLDQVSGDAAFYIASPDQWEELDGHFRPWLDGPDEDELEELCPDWINDCDVIGEIPQSGNYLLVPRTGEKAGYVFEFEHDGFEFIEHAASLEKFVLKMLSPDESALTGMASHMRFIEGKASEQWWIAEMRDNHGNVVRTRT